MNEYIVHTAIKCSDGKIRRLSYDLTEQTEGSVKEFGRVFTEIEKRFPDVQFWIQQYPENFKSKSEKMIDIHGNRDSITPPKEDTENKL